MNALPTCYMWLTEFNVFMFLHKNRVINKEGIKITLNKNTNQMYFVLKILKILFTLFRSTCFGHHCVHHQELLSCTCSLWSLSIIRIHVVHKYVIMYILQLLQIICVAHINRFLTSKKNLRIFKSKYIQLAFLFKVIITMYGTMNLKRIKMLVSYSNI